jgi:hypothetical protein
MAKNSSVGGVDAVASSIDAQTHATLALVEQKRIANLIALAQFSHTGEDAVRLFTQLEESLRLRNEAVEGLGIE